MDEVSVKTVVEKRNIPIKSNRMLYLLLTLAVLGIAGYLIIRHYTRTQPVKTTSIKPQNITPVPFSRFEKKNLGLSFEYPGNLEIINSSEYYPGFATAQLYIFHPKGRNIYKNNYVLSFQAINNRRKYSIEKFIETFACDHAGYCANRDSQNVNKITINNISATHVKVPDYERKEWILIDSNPFIFLFTVSYDTSVESKYSREQRAKDFQVMTNTFSNIKRDLTVYEQAMLLATQNYVKLEGARLLKIPANGSVNPDEQKLIAGVPVNIQNENYFIVTNIYRYFGCGHNESDCQWSEEILNSQGDNPSKLQILKNGDKTMSLIFIDSVDQGPIITKEEDSSGFTTEEIALWKNLLINNIEKSTAFEEK